MMSRAVLLAALSFSALPAFASESPIECHSPKTRAVLRIDSAKKLVTLNLTPETGLPGFEFTIVEMKRESVETLPAQWVTSYSMALADFPEETGYSLVTTFVKGEEEGTADFGGRGNQDHFVDCAKVEN